MLPLVHFFSADDTRIFILELLRSRVRVASIHIFRSVAVLYEAVDALEEGMEGDVDVSYDVDGDAVEEHKNAEECEIDNKPEKVCEMLAA